MLVIREENVKEILSGLNSGKSCGPDGIHPRLQQELSDILCTPLTKLFNKSLPLGKLPSEWKEGRILAIFKKGSRKKAGNYRPISLTSIVCKIMEHCVRNHIVNHMMINNLFSNQQYGFIRGRSTVLQMLNVMDVWTKAIDKGDSIDTVYLDFTKVFVQGHSAGVSTRGIMSQVTSFVILGALIMKGGLCDKEICRRIAMDKAAMGGLTTIWKDSGIRLATKVKSVKGLVFPIHTHL